MPLKIMPQRHTQSPVVPRCTRIRIINSVINCWLPFRSAQSLIQQSILENQSLVSGSSSDRPFAFVYNHPLLLCCICITEHFFPDLKVMHTICILQNPGQLPVQKRLHKVLRINKKVQISPMCLGSTRSGVQQSKCISQLSKTSGKRQDAPI